MGRIACPLTVVMYHYVRPLAHSRFPRLKGLDLADFRLQLDFLERNHTLVGMDAVVAAGQGDRPLPANAALLTFDDGLSDHYAHVFPELHRRNIPGAFFIPTRAVLDRRMLDVHRIHLVLAAAADADALAEEIDRAIMRTRLEFGLDEPAAYRARHAVASRLDTAEVIYVKRMLQTVLPAPLRSAVAEQLFRRFVGTDEDVAVDELYLTAEQLRVMAYNGMHIGMHGDRHGWLGTQTRGEQAADLDDGLRLLDVLEQPADGFTFCYPYGSYNADTLDLLRLRGCAAAFTVVPDIAQVEAEAMLELPRLDTRDLPHGGPPLPGGMRAPAA